MTKNYKNYDRQFLGESDIASLIIRFSKGGAHEIGFGVDGAYGAYVVDEKAVIGEHYDLIVEGEGWAWVYDDNTRTATFKGENIKIYRAGDFGCIIQVTNSVKKEIVETVGDYENVDFVWDDGSVTQVTPSDFQCFYNKYFEDEDYLYAEVGEEPVINSWGDDYIDEFYEYVLTLDCYKEEDD